MAHETSISLSVRLYGAAVRFIQYHENWQESTKANPDNRYWDLVSDLLWSFEDVAIPRHCRDLQAAVESLGVATKRHFDREVAMPDSTFWEAVKGVKLAVQPPGEFIPKRLETIIELDKLGVDARQIAKMYGLVDPQSGKERVDLVDKELRTPGSVIGKDWVHPDEKRRQAEHDEKAQAFKEISSYIESLESPQRRPCPETPRELYALPGMTPEQAAKMLMISVEEVRSLFRSFADEDAGVCDSNTETPPAAESEESGDSDSEWVEEIASASDLTPLSYRQLRDVAKAWGVGIASDKAEMLTRLTAYLEQKTEAPA